MAIRASADGLWRLRSPRRQCWSLRERNDAYGTVGRSDGTERSLPLHWETRSRLSDEASVRGLHQGQQSSGLREQAGHMTASDFCAAREVISCQAGAIHT